MAGAPIGPRADQQTQPALWALVSDLSQGLGVPPPDEIFLIADVNAYVVQHKRLFRPDQLRLLLGMGLLHLLNQSQLAAVLAHELAHLHHGDATWAPLRNVARDIFGATAQGLAGSAVGDVALKGLHATQTKSREAEHAADAAAARLVGRELTMQALVRSSLGTSLFERFMHQDVAPLLDIGWVPDNLFDGYVSFVDRSAPSQGAELTAMLGATQTHLGDSHPALMERLTQLQAMSAQEVSLTFSTEPAIALILDREHQEAAATQAWTNRLPVMGTLQPLAWSDVAHRALSPWMRDRAQLIASRLGVPMPAALMLLLRRLSNEDPAAMARELEPALAHIDDESCAQLFCVFLGHLLAGVLLQAGGIMHYHPGLPAFVRMAGHDVETGTRAAEAVADISSRAALSDVLKDCGINDHGESP